MNAKELLDLLNKQWATTNDIMQIGSIGYHRALEIRKAIAKEIEDDNFKLPKAKVPMEHVVNYFKINIAYLKKISKERI